MQIEEAKTKQEIISLIYQMRYYLLLPINREKQISEEVPQKWLKPVVEKLLDKAEELKIIQKISNNEEIRYNIWKYIFTIRAIKLDDLSIKLTKDKEQYSLQIFDENIFEEKVTLTNIQDKIDLKLNKKIKIFE